MRFPVGAFCLMLVFLATGGRVAAKEHWVKVESGRFTVLTTGAPATALQWALELAQFEVGLQRIIPVATERLRPVTVVLFRSDRAMRPYKPLEKGKPQDIAGFFAQIQDCQAIALAVDSDPAELRHVIYHEVVHWYLRASDQALPPWLEEGLAEVYSTFRRESPGRYEFGSALQAHVNHLNAAKLLPLAELTTIAHGSLLYNEGTRASLFYAESWGLVHFLLFGRDHPAADQIAKYLRANETSSSSDAFQAAFGASYNQMDQKLAAYLHGGAYHTYIYRLPDEAVTATLVAQPAAEGEVELALGVLLVGARAGPTPEAQAHLDRAAVLLPRKPEVWQALGEVALMTADATAAAAEDFGRAIAAGSTSYFCYFARGDLRLRASPGGAFGNPEDYGEMAQDFRRAIELNPRYVPAYERLASVLCALDKLDAGDQSRLERARLLAPDNGMVEVGLAVCDLKSGRLVPARARLTAVAARTDPLDSNARFLAGTLLKDLEWTDFNGRLEALFQERRYAEAVEAIDAAKENFDAPRYHQPLAADRRQAQDWAQIKAAVELANGGRSGDALAILKKIHEESPSGPTRVEAQRLLVEISRGAK